MTHGYRARPLLAGLTLCGALALASCRSGEGSVIRLVTNRPEFAGYAELFNQAEPEYKLELTYAADPLAALSQQRQPDIVVSDRFSCRESLARLDGLDDLFRRGGIRRESFYPGALEMGVADGRQRAVPVAFSLPAVAYRENPGVALEPGVLLEVGELHRLAGEFNRKSGDRWTRLGFSPMWDPAFLLTATVFGPPSYEGAQDCRSSWRNPELTRAVGDLRIWITDTNGGLDAEREFQDRYLYEPYEELLRRDRILFYSLSSAALFDPTPPEGITYRWLGVEGRVPVLPNSLSVGIPRGAEHKAAARVFLRWFLSVEGQQAILAAAVTGPTGEAFGIAGGFSTIQAVNERFLVRLYPSLIGHIPAPEYLRFPQPLPVSWPEISETLVRPWIETVIARTADPEGTLAQELTRTLKEGVDQLRRDRR